MSGKTYQKPQISTKKIKTGFFMTHRSVFDSMGELFTVPKELMAGACGTCWDGECDSSTDSRGR